MRCRLSYLRLGAINHWYQLDYGHNGGGGHEFGFCFLNIYTHNLLSRFETICPIRSNYRCGRSLACPPAHEPINNVDDLEVRRFALGIVARLRRLWQPTSVRVPAG